MPKRNCAFLLCSREDVITINVYVNNLASDVPLPDTKPFDPGPPEPPSPTVVTDP
ncbi:hypothetical protein A2U01_0115569, partial [Trifolium medium]|nr:hypothetical protein [Trifolium medium]